MQSALTLPRVKSTQDEENHDKYQKSDWQTKVGRQRNVIQPEFLQTWGRSTRSRPLAKTSSNCEFWAPLRLEVNSMHTIVALEYRNDVIMMR